jgi:transposase
MNADKNGWNSRERRYFSPQQKVAIVKQHLVDDVPISDLCDEHHIQPNQFYQWQKQLFENGAGAFERKTKASGPTPAERQVEALRAKLATKNEVIAELMEENVLLKKLDGAL